MAKSKKINWASTLERLAEGVQSNEPEGDGWFTSSEFMDKASIGHDRAYRLLRVNLKAGRIECYKGSSWNEVHKQLTRRVWYRFIEGN